MNEFLWWLIGAAATFRLTFLLSESSLLAPLRVWLANGGFENGSRQHHAVTRFAAKVLSCPFCTSWWVGGGVVTLMFAFGLVGPVGALLSLFGIGILVDVVLTFRPPVDHVYPIRPTYPVPGLPSPMLYHMQHVARSEERDPPPSP